jgi:hypothetical protein
MERGPMALFGAIVAVGLGPAMWLGAQFGAMAATPSRPPAVSSELQPNQAPTQQKGGAAGSAPEDPSVVLHTKPGANYRPPHSTPSPSPSASSTPDRPDPGDSTTDPTEATSSPSPTGEPSTPPTESTSEPTDPPTVPPSPPPTDTETANLA